MKPTQMFEKTTTPTESVETEATRKPRLSRKMMYVLTGVFAFVFVVSTVLLSVHFGMKMAKDSYKEYQATVVGDGGAIKHEKVIVTDTEEVFSYDEATGIVDFSTGLLTIRLIRSEFQKDKCYVANVNFTDFQTPKEFKRTHTTSQITFETENRIMRTYDVTDVWLNIKALGPRSAKLCKGKVVHFLLEKAELTTREKRGSGPEVWLGGALLIIIRF